MTISVYNIKGELILNQTIGSNSIQITNLPGGEYIIQIHNQGKLFQQRVTIIGN